MNRNRLLIVDDDQSFRTALASSMTSRGFKVTPAPSGSAALAWLASNECDLMLLDLKMPGMSGMEILRKARDLFPYLEVVLLTGHGTIDTAIEAIRMGAFHYLTKPCQADEVELILHKARERRGLVERATILEDALAQPDVGDSFVGRSSQHQEILRLVDRVAKTDSSVLISGETGVGKELVSKLIHTRSLRRDRPFVVVDCVSLHENLLQSELFGHEKGAYTGASRLKHGLFEVADTGTIFLDEIGDISLALQVKLLRVLETETFRRLGGTKEIKVDIRILAATNRDLPELVSQGHFREDLYYRLSTIRVEVPPLRKRPDDIACLITHFISRLNERFELDKSFSPESMQILSSYQWPGNVRQLINVVEQAMVLSEESLITPAQLPASIRPQGRPAGPAYFESEVVPLSEVERQYIEFVLNQMGGHRAKAASALGIGERSLYRKLKLYGID